MCFCILGLYPGLLYLINLLDYISGCLTTQDSLWFNINHYLPNTSIKRNRNYLAGRCPGKAYNLSLQINRFEFFWADYYETVTENIYKKLLNDTEWSNATFWGRGNLKIHPKPISEAASFSTKEK